MTRSSFPSVRIAGGLLSTDLLSRVVEGKDLDGRGPADYWLAGQETVREEASRQFDYLGSAWQAFTRDRERANAEGRPLGALTRDRWLQQLFQRLGWGRVSAAPSGIEVDGRTFKVSHQHGPVPIHLLGWGVDLDRRTKGVAGAADAAPQSMVQELLNRSDSHLWAIVANGQRLRLLRDSRALAGSAYVEFDLELIFDEQLFSDFMLLFLLVHASRFAVEDGRPAASCWLERWRAAGVEQGERVLDGLRVGVTQAIEALGAGFLRHPANGALRERLESGRLSVADYNHAVLRTVYRLLFWFVAEDRDVLLRPGATVAAGRRYDRYFSSRRLRTRARRLGVDGHDDLWDAVRLVFVALGTERGEPALALPGLGGLFERVEEDESGQPLPASQPDPLDEPLEGARLANEHLIEAVHRLSVTGTVTRRPVDFRHLGAEELGSVYESLLELHPRHDPHDNSFELRTAAGSDRKTTGSYYTPASLTELLLDNALDPVLDAAAHTPGPVETRINALLAVTVCDPACGSGHFLVAAARRIARRVAQLRSGEEEPAPDLVRTAMREVIGRCVYGVDINEMAAELAKVSLWLEAVEPGRPLPFLDANIRVGNALLGTTPALIMGGIPKEAFAPLPGDDRRIATAIAKRSAAEDQGAYDLFSSGVEVSTTDIAKSTSELVRQLPERLADVVTQRRRLRSIDVDRARARRIADAWCAAFVQEKTAELERLAITRGTVGWIADPVPDGTDRALVVERVDRLASDYRFFHWHVEFPHLFSTTPSTRDGFSCLIGNPPWDTLSPDRKEYFSTFNPLVRSMNKAEQDALIANLTEVPSVKKGWVMHQRRLYSAAHFIKASGRYRMFAPGNLGKGDFNVYRMFIELALSITQEGGRVAQIVPSAFHSGANASSIRRELFDCWSLKIVLGFHNAGRSWFKGLHSDATFDLYSAHKGASSTNILTAFSLRSTEELAQALSSGLLSIRADSIRSRSPRTLDIPESSDQLEDETIGGIYSCSVAFGSQPEPRHHYQTEIHMGADRSIFEEYPESALPLYEGRMVDRYDYRAKAWRSGRGRSAIWEPLSFSDPRKSLVPQWYIPVKKVPTKVGSRISRYRVGFGDVTGARNERSLAATIIPPNAICGHTVPTFVYPDGCDWAYLPWLAIANSFSLDFVLRKRVGLHISLNLLDSMPIPKLSLNHTFVQSASPIVLRLMCTGTEMTNLWNSMSDYGWCEPIDPLATPPGIVDEFGRREAMAAIDAIVAREIYQLTRTQLKTILETFGALRRREERKFGEFLSQRLVIEQYDLLSRAGLQ